MTSGGPSMLCTWTAWTPIAGSAVLKDMALMQMPFRAPPGLARESDKLPHQRQLSPTSSQTSTADSPTTSASLTSFEDSQVSADDLPVTSSSPTFFTANLQEKFQLHKVSADDPPVTSSSPTFFTANLQD
eukprot:s1739_g1.t1